MSKSRKLGFYQTTDDAFRRTAAPMGLARSSRAHRPAACMKVSALNIASPQDFWRRLGDNFRIQSQIAVARIYEALIIPVGALFKNREDRDVFVTESAGVTPGEQVIVFSPPILPDGARVATRAPEQP